MSDSIVAALLGNKANTRLALATSLAERNAECEALRAEVGLLRTAPKTIAPAAPRYVRSNFAAERAARMARNRALTAAYFAAYPGERSVTPYQLEQFGSSTH
jgi:hypothetical protein